MNGILRLIQEMMRGIALSYSYIYFSNSLWFGTLLAAVTFFDVGAGLSGITAIIVCQICSNIFSFNRTSALDGSYSYNALMVGLALGTYYQWSALYLAVLII